MSYRNGSSGQIQLFVVKLAESDLTAQGKASDTKIWQVCVPGSQDYQSNYSFHYIFVRPSALAQDVAGEIIKFLFEQIKQIRIQFGWKPGTPIPPELNAIICMDGAGDILAKMIQMIADGDLDGLLLQILKWSAATTSKDQSNDVASTHRTLHTCMNKANHSSSAFKNITERMEKHKFNQEELLLAQDPDAGWKTSRTVVALEDWMKQGGDIKLRKNTMWLKTQFRLMTICPYSSKQSVVLDGWHDIGFGEKPNFMIKLATTGEFQDMKKADGDALLEKKPLYFEEVRNHGRLTEPFLNDPLLGGAPPTTYTNRDRLHLGRARCTLLNYGPREEELALAAVVAAEQAALVAAAAAAKSVALAKVEATQKSNGKKRWEKYINTYATFGDIPPNQKRVTMLKEVLFFHGKSKKERNLKLSGPAPNLCTEIEALWPAGNAQRLADAFGADAVALLLGVGGVGGANGAVEVGVDDSLAQASPSFSSGSSGNGLNDLMDAVATAAAATMLTNANAMEMDTDEDEVVSSMTSMISTNGNGSGGVGGGGDLSGGGGGGGGGRNEFPLIPVPGGSRKRGASSITNRSNTTKRNKQTRR